MTQMEEVRYEFVELESEQSLALLAKAFGGNLQNGTVGFDNAFAKGELVKKDLEEGLWVRKWRLTVFQKISLHRLPAPEQDEKKLTLIYFLNPSLFQLSEASRKVRLNTQRNSLLSSNTQPMHFSVVPKQPFYVLDITFTLSWLFDQFGEADDDCKKGLEWHLENKQPVLTEPCSAQEYSLLHDLDELMGSEPENVLLQKSATYQLVCNFFSKVFLNKGKQKQAGKMLSYDQMIQAEALLMAELQEPPKIEEIAKGVNMSTASLRRQFKSMYGKSLQAYYISRKMEIAGRILRESQISIKKLAWNLGYKHPSHFIETFTKHFGYSPGSLKFY
jgi:AraC-like DNA-binding protein